MRGEAITACRMDAIFLFLSFPPKELQMINHLTIALPLRRSQEILEGMAFVHSPDAPPFPRLFIVSRRIHVFQDQRARIEPPPFALVNHVHAKLFDYVGNFSRAPRESGCDGPATFTAINGGQRLKPAPGLWNDDLPARANRSREQPVEPRSGKIRQVTRDDQIPGRARCSQGGSDSRQRPAPNSLRSSVSSVMIRNRTQSERRISARRPDHCYAGNERLDQLSHLYDKRNTAKIEKAFVPPHARAFAARKNKGSDLAAAFHNRRTILRPDPRLAQSNGRFLS